MEILSRVENVFGAERDKSWRFGSGRAILGTEVLAPRTFSVCEW